MSNYEEIFCQATEILANNLINKVSYDKTILCTIINDSERELGKYRVSNGEADFDAYSIGPKYNKGNSVYVQIPGGDWNEQKFIVSKKVDNENTPIAYKDPFDSFVDVTNNLIFGDLKVQSLKANGQIDEKLLWSYNIAENTEVKNEEAILKNEGSTFNGYTRLGVSCAFSTWLSDFNTVSGNYGLKLEIEIAKDDVSFDTKKCILDCSDMIGNPYNYGSFYSQKKLFDISDIKEIKSIKLIFFQDKNFVDNMNMLIPVGETYPPDIFVKDITISLGYDASEFENDAVIIFSTDSQKYSKDNSNEENHKQLFLRWIHKFDNGVTKVVDENDDIYYKLKWYRYELGHRSDTPWSGVDWTPLSEQILEKNENIKYNIQDESWISYNNNIFNNSDSIRRAPSFNSSWLLPDITRAEEKIKVVITYGESEVLYSNILNFTNEYEVVSKPTVDAVQALSVNCITNKNIESGNYLIYDLGGKILDHADSMIEREFKAYFNSMMDTIDDNSLAVLTEAESIEWVIPASNSMIVIDNSFVGADGNINPTDGNWHIIRYGDSNGNISNNNFQKYKIRSYYSQSYNNNTIKCIVVKNKITYTAVKELTFGPAGTSGTDYTFVLDFKGNNTALTINNKEKVEVVARLYDYEGKDLTELIEGKNITWSFINGLQDISLMTPKSKKKNECELQLELTAMPNVNYTILKATLPKNSSTETSGWGDYDLHAYLPIPIRSDKKYSFISGTTSITYNSLGVLDAYFQNPYEIHIQTTEEDGTSKVEIKSGTWECKSINDTTEQEDPFKPSIETIQDEKYLLRPLKSYIQNSMNGICVVGKIDEDIVWVQPVWVTQNKYPSSIVNDWNGELKIDKANNAVLAAQMVAGSKDANNTFTGVMMGDWGKSGNNNNDIQNSGLFGFKQGVSTFGFKTNGMAYIGDPDKGRLLFDGNKSTITSNRYAENKGGMSLDFGDGIIELSNPTNIEEAITGKILIDASASKTPFKIGVNNKENFKVDWDGTIHANNGVFSGTINSSSINSGTITGAIITGGAIYVPGPTETNSKFSVNSEGILNAEGADIEGTITSEDGKIGGWYIGSTTLSSIDEGKGVVLDSSDGSITGATIRAGELQSNNDTGLIKLSGYLSVNNGQLGSIISKATSDGDNPIMILDGIGMSASNGNRIIASGTNVGMSTSKGYISCSSEGEIVIGGDYKKATFTINLPKENQSGIYARFA